MAVSCMMVNLGWVVVELMMKLGWDLRLKRLNMCLLSFTASFKYCSNRAGRVNHAWSFLSMDDSQTNTFFTLFKLLIVALIVTLWSVKTFCNWEIDNIASSLCFSGTKESTFATMLRDDLLFRKTSSLPIFLLTEKCFICTGDCYAHWYVPGMLKNLHACPLQTTLPS